MREQHFHLRDEELLLHANGELDSVLNAEIDAHLDSCSHCRERFRELEDSFGKFSETHRNFWDAQLPSADQARLSLQSRLAALRAKNEQSAWPSEWLRSFDSTRIATLAALALAACLVIAISLRHPAGSHPPVFALVTYKDEPDLHLTPGATIPVTENDICGTAGGEPPIPVSLKQKVFKLYRVTQPPDEFEVDYLITPQLGGATDIRNLWPEPYHDAVWNAHVKDQLEDRLHRMVCRGDLDLATAQRDISTDWIAAYRKYFHTDRPIADNSTANFSSQKKLLPNA
ncbi:MAG: zf-HC2 domain-containing protein [Candidatus Sulfotelmatobacter sp.]